MRTPADCIHALNGCFRVGNPERWMVGVDEAVVDDIIFHLKKLMEKNDEEPNRS